jgi:tyrosyl-tRNA synthetase
MIQDMIPGTDELLMKETVTGYVGFDPTAESLHIGSLIPIILLMHLQRAGHKPLALVGGATGMVGDPSFKSEERKMLDEETLQINLAGIKRQLEQFLDFSEDKPNKAEIVNNYDWFKNFTFLNFIRDVGKHITVNYMMHKDSVKKRLEGQNGMSFTEFSYQLIQGYDFYWLYTNKDCKLQMGGSDQWGNIVTGTELIRRLSGKEGFAFTCPLLKKADGGKFGKTEQGNVWLDPTKTSPYQFYQFWFNASDTDAESWIKIFTFLDKPTIDALIEEHKKDTAKRLLQQKLAEEVTLLVHGKTGLDQAIQTTQQLFGKSDTPIEEMSEEDLQAIDGITKTSVDLSSLKEGMDIINLVAGSGIFSSKGEARKMIQNGGLSVNRKKVTDMQQIINTEYLLHDKYLLIQKGKKQFFLVEAK